MISDLTIDCNYLYYFIRGMKLSWNYTVMFFIKRIYYVIGFSWHHPKAHCHLARAKRMYIW